MVEARSEARRWMLGLELWTMLSDSELTASDVTTVSTVVARKLPKTAVKTTASILPEVSRPNCGGAGMARSIHRAAYPVKVPILWWSVMRQLRMRTRARRARVRPWKPSARCRDLLRTCPSRGTRVRPAVALHQPRSRAGRHGVPAATEAFQLSPPLVRKRTVDRHSDPRDRADPRVPQGHRTRVHVHPVTRPGAPRLVGRSQHRRGRVQVWLRRRAEGSKSRSRQVDGP